MRMPMHANRPDCRHRAPLGSQCGPDPRRLSPHCAPPGRPECHSRTLFAISPHANAHGGRRQRRREAPGIVARREFRTSRRRLNVASVRAGLSEPRVTMPEATDGGSLQPARQERQRPAGSGSLQPARQECRRPQPPLPSRRLNKVASAHNAHVPEPSPGEFRSAARTVRARSDGAGAAPSRVDASKAGGSSWKAGALLSRASSAAQRGLSEHGMIGPQPHPPERRPGGQGSSASPHARSRAVCAQ